jgi:CheY-like chemotaxis protein
LRLNKIKNIPKVAFLSAYMSDREMQKGIALGASAYLDKPIDPEKLRQLLISVDIQVKP